jgi:hypothetical protein
MANNVLSVADAAFTANDSLQQQSTEDADCKN